MPYLIITTGSSRNHQNARHLRRHVKPHLSRPCHPAGRVVADQLLRETGGAYQLDEVCQLLGDIPEAEVHRLAQEKHLLWVTRGGRRVYPKVQFGEGRQLLEGLSELFAILVNAGGWSMLAFLTEPQDELSGLIPIDLLRSGRTEDKARVLQAARMQNVHAA